MADPLFVKIHVWSWFKLNDCFLFWRLQNHKAMREPDVSPHFWHELRSSQVKHAGGLMVRLIPNLFDLWIYLIQYEPLMKSTLDPGSMDFIGFDLRAMVVLASKIVCPSRAQLGCGDHTILVWDGFLEINMVLTRLSVASDVGFQPKKLEVQKQVRNMWTGTDIGSSIYHIPSSHLSIYVPSPATMITTQSQDVPAYVFYLFWSC